ncbi:hypothetical protein TNCV_1270961 [Trichonephila clavipes]|nr:hypothetical protein TNCV_1270961 [Trichonephila clavipes]
MLLWDKKVSVFILFSLNESLLAVAIRKIKLTDKKRPLGKNPQGEELAKSGPQHDNQVAKMGANVTNLVTKYYANFWLNHQDFTKFSLNCLIIDIFRVRRVLVVKITYPWPACHEFKPSATEDPSFREVVHVKSMRSQMSSRWCSVEAMRGGCHLRCRSRH